MEQLEEAAAQAQDTSTSTSSTLLFAINGLRFQLPDPNPNLTLLHFLRTHTPFRGPKLGCGEGGCGACVVLLAKFHPATGQLSHSTVSSCLTLLPAIHHCSITTTEGLGSSRHGYHAIHQRLAGFHASQCGFCTPGISVSLYSSLLDADTDTTRPEPRDGFSRITLSEAESALSGHLCRCTGYRPIVDACKSFSACVDIEDLGFNSFQKKGADDGHVLTDLPLYSPDGGFCTFPEFLKAEIKSSVPCRYLAGGRWHCPRSIQDLCNLLDSDLLKSANRVKLVSGNTSSGVYRELNFHDHFIDLRGIPEMNVIAKDNDGVEIGASITISKVIQILRKDNKSRVFLKLADHMEKVASKFIRNMASIGGNLIMAQRDQFESDIATILLGAATTVNILLGSEMQSLTLKDFLQMPPCTNKIILLSIYIPSWISSPNVLFQTYRASARPLGNAVAYVNASFLAQTLIDDKTGDVILDNILLAFGAYGTEHAIRARKVEEFLSGKPVTTSTLLEAVRILRQTLVVKEGTSYAAYRISLAIAFLFKFLSPVTKGLIAPRINGCVDVETSDLKGLIIGNLHEENQILHSSKQKIEHSTEYFPAGAATKKIGSEMQASGEAVYVDDIPSPRDCLYGAFIYSTKPLARVKDIGLSSSAHKVVSVVSANDIPKEGSNVGACTIFGPEPLFANSIAEYAGQPIGLVVAQSQTLANMAAGNAIVSYSTDNLEAPILTLEAAVQRSSYFVVPPFLCPQQVGDFSKGMEEADHKIISSEVTLSSQYWFYMETQTALAVPDEDNCMVVYTSCQTPETAQNVIATCLGVPFNNVRVITRRVGGGFGGKAVRALPVAAACALAAHKLRRPVRIYLDRKTDMIISGGRHPMKVTYSVGFKSDGKITALHLDILINAGATQDVSLIIPHNLVGPLKKYNWGALSFDIKVCKTNLSTKSAMRAPGEVQGSYIAEAVIENVASFLSLDVSVIREKNLHSYESLSLFYRGIVEEPSEYTLPSLISKLVSTACYRDRVEVVHSFNRSNVWRKRGIAWVPIVHGVMLRPTPGKVSVLNDGSVVVEVGGIELGQGLWTKVKQMTAFGLGQLGYNRDDSLFEKIRVIQADTLSMVQGGWTTGSTTSESSCEAVRLSCDTLVERLKPIKENLETQNSAVTWDTLIKQASMASVNLSASAYWVPSVASMSYLNYGAAVSEVEVDILTGSTTILQSDLIYDCGQSLNPAVDLGQIEGAFVQGIGYFMLEEYVTNVDGMLTSDGTWTYKIPTVDTIPKKFNVELVNSGHHKNRVLSSKASGEPPLLLASSVHSATRDAITAARVQYFSLIGSKDSPLEFQLPVPATMSVVKELCGFDHVEKYLEALDI